MTKASSQHSVLLFGNQPQQFRHNIIMNWIFIVSRSGRLSDNDTTVNGAQGRGFDSRGIQS